MVRGLSNPFYTRIITEIGDKIEKAGYTMVMQQIASSADEVMTGAMMERDKRLLGLIFLGGRLDYSKEQLITIGVPYVCCSFNNKYGTLDRKEYSSVCIDDNQAAYEAVERLYNKGHRRIAVLLARPDDGSVSQVRYEGYERALNDLGLQLDEDLIISTDTFNIKDAYIATKEWLNKKIEFDAIFAIADNLAMGASKALREAGKVIPGDVAIIAIDGIEASEYMNPELTTLCQPMTQMGTTAVQLLTDLIEGKNTNKHVLLPTVFREGGTL